ncbi:MAG: CHAP domain-containing protein, partial [Ruminococcaceae bacterium]|nr:CHAP domain-containing protein [Oscillospiraceae bacterium]
MMRRKISAVLVLLLVLTILPNFLVAEAYDAAKPLPELTGDQIHDLVYVAASQIGYSGHGRDDTIYGAAYGINGMHWCAAFVSWCADKAGISSDIVYRGTYVPTMMEWYRSRGQLYSTPQNGDIIFMEGADDDDIPGHVGIVDYTDGNKVYYIHGNNSSDVVAYSSYTLGDPWILGYGRPKYVIPPTGAWMWKNKEAIKVGEEISFNYNATGATNFYLGIDKIGVGRVRTVDMGSNDWYTTTFSEPGTYAIYATCGNSAGFADSNKETFYVYNSLPTKPTVTGQKSEYASGENFSINWSDDGSAYYYWLHIYDENGKDYKNETLGKATSYSHTFPVGKYTIYITAANPYGETTANAININVGKYTISYDANGGTGAPAAQTKIYGEPLTLSTTKPTRTGYTFKKWNTKKDGSGSNYASGGTWSANDTGLLYAQWTPNTYTVKFDANG